jgi:hypothetical protein
MKMTIGTDVNTTAGSTLYISESLPTADSLAAFQAVGSYTKVGEITDLSEIPVAYTAVNHESIDERATKVLKGLREAQTLTLTMGRVVTDAGQQLLKTYCDDASYRDSFLTLKIVHKDGTTFYGIVLVMSVNTTFGSANTITALTATLTFNSDVWEDTTTYYTVHYVAGTGGSIVGDAIQRVADGADATPVYAHASALYEFTEWDVIPTTDNPRTDTAIDADVTVTATFTLV